MDSVELRSALESTLDIVQILLGGTEVSEDDLQNIETVCQDIREKLKEPQGTPQRFPGDLWVFSVARTQQALLAVPGKDLDEAHANAASELHDNIEGLRFTWDRSDPMTLSVLKLHREPETP